MHRTATTAILALAAIAATLSASAAKLNGSAALKDLQPFGTTDKEHKHQAYDLSCPGGTSPGEDYDNTILTGAVYSTYVQNVREGVGSVINQ